MLCVCPPLCPVRPGWAVGGRRSSPLEQRPRPGSPVGPLVQQDRSPGGQHLARLAHWLSRFMRSFKDRKDHTPGWRHCLRALDSPGPLRAWVRNDLHLGIQGGVTEAVPRAGPRQVPGEGLLPPTAPPPAAIPTLLLMDLVWQRGRKARAEKGSSSPPIFHSSNWMASQVCAVLLASRRRPAPPASARAPRMSRCLSPLHRVCLVLKHIPDQTLFN